MALFAQQNADIGSDIMQLRDSGMEDSEVMAEMTRRGYRPDQVSAALMQSDQGPPVPEGRPSSSYPDVGGYPPPQMESALSAPQENLASYDRIAEIAENIIDEKWEQLITEVRKIIEWKEKVEEKQRQLTNDVQKLKEDFKVLHQGVLGKLDDYDARMRDVGTELGAVGKVFKDVIPEFVENVKELSHLTGKMKKK
ncbi:hypothetical protein HY495_01480 [Candidatus Woesearchaeota archaeon]|nr:hypothetical protein [Candidatus Woesearchaeota archaeon]